MSSVKGPGPSPGRFDGSSLRIAIVHARWNKVIIDALVTGAISKLKESGVKDTNIVVLSVPGSYELPIACSKCVVLHSIPYLRTMSPGVESSQAPAHRQDRLPRICLASGPPPPPTTPRLQNHPQSHSMQSSRSVFSSRVRPCTLSTFVTAFRMVS